MPVPKKRDYWIKDSIRDKAFDEFFTLGRELGRGALSCVYQCQHKGTGENWAVKIIDKDVNKKVMCSETGLFLRLDNPYVIRLKEVFETPTQIFLVQELATGGELLDRIGSSGHYTEKNAAKAVNDMLRGLQYLHANGIIHRNLKPENLLFENMRDDAKLKITDFGLSRLIDPQVQMRAVCETPGYCAPEIVRGEPYTPAADLWSVGVIAYILLCGLEPFCEENKAELFRKIIKGYYTFPDPYWEDVSENAKDLVRKLLIVEPKKRLTASEALKQPWVKGGAAKCEKMEAVMEKIKTICAKHKLKLPLLYHDKFGEDLGKKLQAELRTTASALLTPGKGILAADESVNSMGQILEGMDLENTEDNRRRYREVLFTTDGVLAEYLSGVILFPETLYQSDSKGTKFVELLAGKGIIPGVKVDTGLVPLAGSPEEFTTQGLDDLAQRCLEYKKAGAKFTKWRCVLKITEDTPSYQALVENTNVMARYASICQQCGLVPIVEPEVLPDGQHQLEVTQKVTEEVLAFQFKALADHDVFLEGIVLKPNMVLAGRSCENTYKPAEVAMATITALSRSVPPAVPGITFLSGGQFDEDATINLNFISQLKGNSPWTLTFCYGRALQSLVLIAWQGKDDNVAAAQEKLIQQAKANSQASLGTYHVPKH